ncbi:pyridoxal phosphate-dependent aminotransferase [Pontibacter akesuensis]|uniref:Aminotransferase n=1 Tax=Pontibacter akesuensis TaxID=388950 RepID=A0A1I7KMC4_9BACT|nr:aminotransferase class I/II-fold pyridoxal phosphate-dependent enzyme [Pontibacter akesuensis]GHA77631.1 aminotransferase [Pontibacter akesuensis]SFU98561.1 Aspartate/methionine/tyrosine aminotransferase [Pontibacter akesuensis]
MIIPKANRLEHVQEYFFSRKLAEVRALQAQGKSIINLGIGSPDMAPSAATVEALTQSAQQTTTHGYQPYNGTARLRQAMQQWYQQQYGVALTEQEVLPLAGSKEGIFHISMAFLNPGDKVLVPNPGYPAYAAAARLAGAEAVNYTLEAANDWLPQEAELEQLVTQGGYKMMWINYPHMPTGKAAASHTLQELVAFTQKHGLLLLNDNPYSLVLQQQEPISLLSMAGAKSNCLELNSLSKSHNMAGWRVGMVLGQQVYLAAILAVKSNLDSGQLLPVQEAAIAALQNNTAWHADRNAVYAERKQLAQLLLDELECVYQPNQVGMFLWARVPESIADVEAYLDTLLHKQGLFLTPGNIFGSQGERYIRVSLCAPAAQISEAINRIKSSKETLTQVYL